MQGGFVIHSRLFVIANQRVAIRDRTAPREAFANGRLPEFTIVNHEYQCVSILCIVYRVLCITRE